MWGEIMKEIKKEDMKEALFEWFETSDGLSELITALNKTMPDAIMEFLEKKLTKS